MGASDSGGSIFIVDTSAADILRNAPRNGMGKLGSVAIRHPKLGNVTYSTENEEPSVTLVRNNCEFHSGVSEPRPCAVTSLAFLNDDLIVVGLQGGIILGIDTSGTVLWHVEVRSCGQYRETRNLSNCAVRNILVSGEKAFATVDNGTARLRVRSRLAGARVQVWLTSQQG